MKKLSILSAVLVALMLTSMAAAAEADPAAADGVYAVLTLEGGDTVVDEAPSADELGGVESYDLFIEEQNVLTVEQVTGLRNDPVEVPVFYSVDFTIPETTYDVFLTGLTAENVEEVQQAIVDSFESGKSFDIEDLGFIDTEKTYTEDDGDDYMCWAASASDMLVYTGWAARAGFENEDDVFEAFIDSYDDDGGNQYFAMAWFFNGTALNDNSGRYGAVITDYPDSGRYLSDYAYDRYTDLVFFEDSVNDMNDIMTLLRGGYAIGLGVYLYTSGELNGGHAVTLWGTVIDSALSEDDPARYVDIFLTDSDSYESHSDDRLEASNVMNVYPLNYSAGGDYYYFDFDRINSGVFWDYVYLAPYSEEVFPETAPDATKDKINTADLSLAETFLFDSATGESGTLFESGSGVSFKSIVMNTADTSYSDRIYIYFTVTDSDGVQVYRDGLDYNRTSIGTRSYITSHVKTWQNAAAGDYTVTYTVNHSHNAAEAYFCNNTVSVDFKVRDSYLSGDFDGSGAVDILDATAIQRRLAGYSTSADGRADERGDVNGNGLDIMDATSVQRSKAELDTADPVGEKRLYI